MSNAFVSLFVSELNVTLYNVTVNVCEHHQVCNDIGCGVSNSTVCNCDDDCVGYGDCCWDFATTCNRRYIDYVYDWEVGLTTCEIVIANSPRHSMQSYFMVGRCPTDWPNTVTRELCERYDQNDSVIHWLRVDNQQGVTFKNIFCAFCNGMEPRDVTSWTVFGNCSDENINVSSTWSHLQEKCSDLEMKPANPLILAKLRACSCCVPYKNPNEDAALCGESVADSSSSKACALYKAPITVGRREYNNPHCLQCDISRNNIDSNIHGGTPSQDFCQRERYGPSSEYVESDVFTYRLHFVVPVSVFFDLPTIETLFKITKKGSFEENVKSCEKGSLKSSRFDDKCDFKATIDDLCDNTTSHGYKITAEIRLNRERVQNINESTVLSSLLYFLMDLFKVPLKKFQVLDNSAFCFPRNGGTIDTPLSKRCKLVFNVTVWLDYNEYGRYFDDLISDININSVIAPADFIPQQLDIVRGCRNQDALPRTLRLGNLDDALNSTNTMTQNNNCLNEDCTYVVLTRKLKTHLHFVNASTKDLTVSYIKQSCIVRWCELHFAEVNKSLDDYDFFNSAAGSIGTISRWNQTHVFVCSSMQNDSDRIFQAPHQILTLVGCVISIIALMLTLLTYARFPLLRKTTFVKLVMALAGTLLIGQLLLLVFLGAARFNAKACAILSVVAHYVWLSVFTYMLLIAFELYRTFGRRKTKSTRGVKPSVFITYLTSAMAFPLLIIIPCLILHLLRRTSLTYGDISRGCWLGDASANLIAFVLPITLILVLNAVVFVATVYHLCTSRGDVFKNDVRKRRTEARRNLRISMKAHYSADVWRKGTSPFCLKNNPA
nr:uncharacterized protein LOC129267793 [Lytechinus pictus]